MLLGLRSLKTKPKFLAAETRAASSGDCAWYSSLPAGELHKHGKKRNPVPFQRGLTAFFVGHHCVTECQQLEKAVHRLVFRPHRLEQTPVVEFEFWLKVRIAGEVYGYCAL